MEKKESNNEKEGGFFSFISNLFKPFKALFMIHVKFAMLEFKKDSRRFLSGIVSVFLGLFLLSVFWLLVNGAAIVIFYEFVFGAFLSTRLILSILAVGGINLFLAIILFVASQQSMKAGFLTETRKIFQDTVDELKE